MLKLREFFRSHCLTYPFRVPFCLVLLAAAGGALPLWAGEGSGTHADKTAENASTTANEASEPVEASDHELVKQLLLQIGLLNKRVAELESHDSPTVSAKALPSGVQPDSNGSIRAALIPPPSPVAPAGVNAAAAAPDPSPEGQDAGGHNMSLPGGPVLNIRGFLDFNFDAGTAANPLIYPLTIPPPATVHDTFQFGEFDLFMSSRLSNTIGFLSEIVFGSDASNAWGIDIERAQLTYKPSPYFQISGGRMHTAIGYYNTAYHHGTWFQTATGRPYMYFYEDSGGILPVHIVGLEAAGLVPGAGKLNAHWIAEVGNGESSAFIGQPIVNDPVQNFVSETDHKAYNLAGYIKLGGLQIGGNYYNAVRVPDGVPHVNNAITGAYVVYLTPVWEFFNELQVQRDHSYGSPITYNTPLGYTQLSRKFGKYRPYFRWQEVNVPVNDPLYGSVGRYEGPSVGLRMDFADFAALKVQYNRIYTRNPSAMNGLDSQVAFTF